jgi:transcriptional regulator with XRE-family HTH domain
MEPILRLRARQVDLGVLGRRLREARLAAGLTQAEVAGDATSVPNLSRIERGERRPRPELLAALADALGVPVAALLDDAPPPVRRGESVPWAEHWRAANAARATARWLDGPRDARAFRRMIGAVAAWEAEARLDSSALDPEPPAGEVPVLVESDLLELDPPRE